MIGLAPEVNGKYDFDVPVGGCIVAPYLPAEYVDSTGRVFCKAGTVDESSIDTEFYGWKLNTNVCFTSYQTGYSHPQTKLLPLTSTVALCLYEDKSNSTNNCMVRRIKPDTVANNSVKIDSDGASINTYVYESANAGEPACAEYINGKVIIGTTKGNIFFSSDLGKTWSNATILLSSTAIITYIGYCNGKYIIGLDNTSSNINVGDIAVFYYSTDLVNWALVNNMPVGIMRGCVIGNNNLIGYVDGNMIYSLSNFTTWTSVLSLPSSKIYDSILFDSKVFLCGEDNYLWVSSNDGITWTNLNTLTSLSTSSAYTRMFEYNNELFICQSDNGLTQRVFKIVKGSSNLIPVTIENETTRVSATALIDNTTYKTYYSKPFRQKFRASIHDANYIFYVNYNGDLVFNPTNNNGIRFKYNAGNFEKIYEHPSSKSLVKKLLDNTYYYADVTYLPNSVNGVAIYSDLFKKHTVTLPTGFTHMRTK